MCVGGGGGEGRVSTFVLTKTSNQLPVINERTCAWMCVRTRCWGGMDGGGRGGAGLGDGDFQCHHNDSILFRFNQQILMSRLMCV